MTIQSHQLILENVINRHPLFQAMRAGNPGAGISPVVFAGFRLDLPDRDTAAANGMAMAGDIADTGITVTFY